MKKLSYITDGRRTNDEVELILSTMFYTLVASFCINVGYNVVKKIERKISDKNKDNRCTTIILSKGNKNIVTDVKNSDYAKDKYRIVEIDDYNWVVYVYGSDRTEYAYFLASNMYFNEEDKIIFDTNNASDENYEEFTLDKSVNININQRVRK